jgi:hypothetical protein
METRGPTVTQPLGGRTLRFGAVALVASLGFGACSGSDDDAGQAISPVADESVASDTGADFVPSPDLGDEGGGEGGDVGEADGSDAATASSSTEFDLAAQPSTPAIEPIPETGVPGIDSSDVFCRAWSEFAGSFQALALVSAIGDSDAAYRLEVIAASTVTAAVNTMDVNLPNELEAERVALIADLAGPFLGRAVLAEADLLGAGIEPPVLRDVWIDALTEAGVDDPELQVVVPDAIDAAALNSAVASFSNAQLAIVGDPALITEATIPLTEAYLADVCPDGGILSGNDVIDN